VRPVDEATTTRQAEQPTSSGVAATPSMSASKGAASVSSVPVLVIVFSFWWVKVNRGFVS